MSNKLLISAAILVASAANAQNGITELGTMWAGETEVQGISDDGSVAVGFYVDDPGAMSVKAFRWTQGSGMVDLGTLGGTESLAYGVSGDGSVVVGYSYLAGHAAMHAFRWTQAGGMVDLGTLGGTISYATSTSLDGSVAVGTSSTAGNIAHRAFRWTQAGGMTDLGTLGGSNSWASDVSADGSIIVGSSDLAGNINSHAFRWTQAGGMTDLGTLGGSDSEANDVSADGSVVVGESYIAGNANFHAFRWTQASGMQDLGTLGGSDSWAGGVSGNGLVVVGSAEIAGNANYRAFRWTQAGGMQSVEDWLRSHGIVVPADITKYGSATNYDGSVVVGQLTNSHGFIARVSDLGSGLITQRELQKSLTTSSHRGRFMQAVFSALFNGAHSRPLSRRVAKGQKTFWLSGDLGRDDHAARDGNFGIGEVGGGINLGNVQINLSLGQSWAKQNTAQHGASNSAGTYLLAEALLPLSDQWWATVSAFGHAGDAKMKRGYQNAGAQDYSTGRPDASAWGVRARLEWDKAYQIAKAYFSPYVDLTYSVAKLEGFTELGGGFPARYDSRKDKATELRVGVNIERPVRDSLKWVGLLEGTHRLEKKGSSTSGEIIGLFNFDIPGDNHKQNWLHAGGGIEGKIADGTASIMLNMTTRGESPNYWLAASWQKNF